MIARILSNVNYIIVIFILIKLLPNEPESFSKFFNYLVMYLIASFISHIARDYIAEQTKT